MGDLTKYTSIVLTKKYADFSGRARRKEYWYFYLFEILLFVALEIVVFGLAGVTQSSAIAGVGGVLLGIVALALIIPGLAVTVRRLHDTGRSGWWFLIVLVPIAGPLILLYFTIIESSPGENQWGPNPIEAGD